MSRYLVGIMGAGMMAQGFDAPGDAQVLTIAHALTQSPDFILGGFYDIDPARAEAAEGKWGCGPSPRDRGAWLDRGWDVVLIATPDACHAADLREVLGRRPKAVVVEKPIATDGEEGLRLLLEARRQAIPVLVDFPRRWHTGVSVICEHIREGTVGRPVSAVFVYTGEAAHSAVHMLDLFHTWWGGGWQVTLRSGHGPVTTLALGRGGDEVTVSCVGLPADCQYVWEMHVYCEAGKVELSRSPEVLELSVARPHPVYLSFHVLTQLKQFPMEEEPLLMRLLETLAAVIADPATARAWTEREIESQDLSAQVLRHFAGER